jgi:hypothetical protein
VEKSFFNATLFDTLLNRRSRRVGLGMSIPEGPLKYASSRKPIRLSEEEEAALAFAACGITGHALADLSYGPQQGGTMLAGRVGRTVASADAVNTVAVVVTNDEATYLLKRPQDFASNQIPELVQLAREKSLVELYGRSRVKIKEGRTAPALDEQHNFPINKWSLYAPGTTYFLPIIETTALTINALLELFEPGMGVFIRDERAWFRPAGLAKFAKSNAGHLHDNAADLRTATIQAVETSLGESMATEQGMVLQNLSLAAEALGLGGFPNFARHEFSWFDALGFRMRSLPATRYAGAPRLLSGLARRFGRDVTIPFPIGLEQNETPLLKPYSPPYYNSMTDAVRAFVETKFGAGGIYCEALAQSAWREPNQFSRIPAPSAAAIDATIAYCEYVYQRYGRFPAYAAPFRTIIGFQVCRTDPDFYQRFYSAGQQ